MMLKACQRVANIILAGAVSLTAATDSYEFSLGPGAGGQIQGVTLHPEINDRAFFMMDVEGAYRTDNAGQSWNHMKNNVVMYYTTELKVKPGVNNHLYMGSFWGLMISKNGGANWDLVGESLDANDPAFQMRNNVMGTIEVDPDHPNRVWVGQNWRVQDFSFGPLAIDPQQKDGARYIWYSLDSGSSWKKSRYEQENGRKQVYSIKPDQANSNILWVSAHSGLYKGTLNGNDDYTWQRVNGPALSENNMDGKTKGNGKSYGMDITPDGQYMIVCFGIDPNDQDVVKQNGKDIIAKEAKPLSLPYIAKVSDVKNGNPNWVCLARSKNQGMLFVADTDTEFGWDYGAEYDGKTLRNHGNNYWRPVIDPRSTGNRIKVLLGEMEILGRGEGGLFEGDFDISGSADVNGEWVRIYSAAGRKNSERQGFVPGSIPTFDYDYGWQNLSPRARHYSYSPTTWEKREIWVGNDQNLYRIDTLNFNDRYTQDPADDFKYYHDWKPLNTQQVSTINGKKTYGHRGIVSTVDYGTKAYENYVINCGADNSVYESYDGGKSWVVSPLGLGQSDSVEIIPALNGNPPMVVASHSGMIFGGGSLYMSQEIYIKVMDTMTPNDKWIKVAGGNNGLAGFRRGTPYPDAAKAPRALDLSYEPKNPNRLYITGSYGVYVLDDIKGLHSEMKAQIDAGTHKNNLVASKDWIRKIYDDGTANPITTTQYRRCFTDETDAGVIYIATRQDVIKGVRSGSNYTFSNIYNSQRSQDNISTYYTWEDNGMRYHSVGTGESDGSVWLKIGDQAWSKVLSRDEAIDTTQENTWLETLETHFGNRSKFKLAATGLAGFGKDIIVSYSFRQFRQGLGVLKGKIQADGSVQWEDWTGDTTYGRDDYFYQPWIRKANIVLDKDGDAWYFGASQGAGSWAKALGASSPSPEPAPDVKPDVPTGLSASSSNGKVTVTWDDSPNETQYILQRRLPGDSWRALATLNANITSYTDANVTSGDLMKYRIKAKNNKGASIFSKAASVTVTGNTPEPEPEPTEKPNVPSGLTVVAGDSSNLILSWNDLNNETEYELQRKIGSENFKFLTKVNANVVNLNDQNLEAGVTHQYRIKARNGSGASVWSSAVSATPTASGSTPSEPTSKPGLVQNFQIQEVNQGLKLTWSGDDLQEEFIIQRQLPGDSFRALTTLPGTARSYIDSMSSIPSDIAYRIKARNSIGASTWVTLWY